MNPLRFNSLEVRLATRPADLEAAQALRYRVFYDEMGATPASVCYSLGRDVDRFDENCDHLLVVDLEDGNTAHPCVVGTYRLLRRRIAEAANGFYTETEFDLGPLLSYPGEIMELGRSCIHPTYRKRGAMQLLWRGIADYVSRHHVRVMFGCGSIHGTDPNEARRVLAYLHHYHGAPSHLRPRALAGRYVPMDRMMPNELDQEMVHAELPPLLKGYLRLGGCVGDGAVIDHQFKTIDVCVVVETAAIKDKYFRHFAKSKAVFEPPRIDAAE